MRNLVIKSQNVINPAFTANIIINQTCSESDIRFFVIFLYAYSSGTI